MGIKRTSQDFNALRYAREWKITPAEKVRAQILVKTAGTGRTILDLGCYDGTIAAILKSKGNSVVGIEISPQGARLANGKGVTCLRADLNEALPFADDSFDLVFCAEVIEHIFDMKLFLMQIKRVLKKDGVLLISTPNLASFGRRFLLFFGKNPLIENESEGGAAGHIRYFVKEALLSLLKKYNFMIKSFCSDLVNFDNSGRHFSRTLARIAPGLGKSLIVEAINEKD